MQGVQFWLITLYDATIALHLAGYNSDTKTVNILATGLSQSWNGQIDSLIQAIEISKDGCSQLLGQSHTQVKKAAFVLSPYWVGVDGKITPEKKQIIEAVCTACFLQPMGFSSYDEALTEHLSSQEGQINTVLVQVLSNQVVVTLVVAGKVRQRQSNYYPSIENFTPKILEDTLYRLKAAGVLPPEMILFGDAIDNTQTDQLIRHHWSGKGGRELFIQPPNIKKFTGVQIAQLYAEFVVGHLYTDLVPTQVKEMVSENNPPQVPASAPTVSITEVAPEIFGFRPPDSIITPVTQETIFTNTEPLREAPPRSPIPRINLKLPSKKLAFILPPIFLLVLFMIYITVTGTATVVFYTSALQVDKSIKVTLDTQAKGFDPIKSVIPVLNKNSQVEVVSSTAVTGKRQTGEKAKGEILIYNKSEKAITILKNTVLKDAKGMRFILLNNTTVAGAQANLEAGVISLGQTKALVVADAIGADGNIAKDIQLSFDQNNATTSLLAKSISPFTGGSSRDITVISKEDRTKVDKALQEEIKLSLQQKLGQEAGSPDVLASTVRVVKGKTEYNRELDEEASVLEGRLKATVSVMSIPQDIKEEIINNYIKQDTKFDDANLDYQAMNLSFVQTSQDDKQAIGTLKITGNLSPKIDISSMSKKLAFKKYSQIQNILASSSSHIFDYKIQSDSLFGKLLKQMPVSAKNINLVQEVK